MIYDNRRQAGEMLGEELAGRGIGKKALLLGIPRGGVETACFAAKKIGCEFGIIIAGKIALPRFPETAIGAVVEDGTTVKTLDNLDGLSLTPAEFKKMARVAKKEVRRRIKIYRHDGKFPQVKDKTVVIIDDGMATGATAAAAAKSVRRHGAVKVVAAVPAASAEAVEFVKKYADEVISLCTESPFFGFAVGAFYKSFPPLSDREVKNFLSSQKEKFRLNST